VCGIFDMTMKFLPVTKNIFRGRNKMWVRSKCDRDSKVDVIYIFDSLSLINCFAAVIG
jgi:hypothetical protein